MSHSSESHVTYDQAPRTLDMRPTGVMAFRIKNALGPVVMATGPRDIEFNNALLVCALLDRIEAQGRAIAELREFVGAPQP